MVNFGLSLQQQLLDAPTNDNILEKENKNNRYLITNFPQYFLLLLDCILAFTQIKLFPHMLWMEVGQNTLVGPGEALPIGPKSVFRVICFWLPNRV